MAQFANLGTAAVLDPDCLTVGQHTEIDGQLLVVEKIEGINVFFRPVTGWELWKHRLNQIQWTWYTIGFVVVVLASVVWCCLR
jgi:hypothetical protein